MAEENNVHVKVAMADVLGCFLIGVAAFLVSLLGFKQIGTTELPALFISVLYLGVGFVIVTVMMFLNENMLGTAIFGTLAVDFIAFYFIAVGGLAGSNIAAYLTGFVGFLLLVYGLLSLLQPVKMLSLTLIIAFIAFECLAWWQTSFGHMALGSNIDTQYTLVGVFFILLAICATYLGAAVAAFVMKGKPILPLLIMAKK
jgi:hypothetical protein